MKKNICIITILIIFSALNIFAQTMVHNTPVESSVQLSCQAIKPLTVYPLQSNDYINWPTIPVGSKYVLNSSENEDADWKSLFTITGEPGYALEISIDKQLMVDNVEIAYTIKGTPIQYLGVKSIPVLNFDGNGKVTVNLNAEGAFYVHVIYNWVWAKENATTGVKSFVQKISTQYYNL